ncbi:MAG: pyruvate kinase [Actinomycetota bacterium]|jgi:pyruvate kinase
MRRAKIVCTIGPAVSSPEKIAQLIDTGMNMARLNLSHGTTTDHEKSFNAIRAAAKSKDQPIAILVDLQGPKIRLGKFQAGPYLLAVGDKFTITTEEMLGDKNKASTTYKDLPKDCQVGDQLLINDGKVVLEVLSKSNSTIETKVLVGGEISNNKGINLPGVAVSAPALTEKDAEDLRWGLKMGADFIALSFVRSAKDIDGVKKIMNEMKVQIPVIAKIEKPQAIKNIEEIVAAFDGVMVARGDLGVELPIEDVPMLQKQCVTLARENAKPVIVATQMLESMINNSTPTRAEATDCANAVLDGADALMLSGETSVGEFPLEAVKVMARIIERTEQVALNQISPLQHNPSTKGGAITKAATEVGAQVDAKYLIAFTQSGDSARRMSRLRSPIPILAMTPDQSTLNRLSITWGVEPMLAPMVKHTDEMVMQVDNLLINSNRVKRGELVLIVAGSPPGIPGSTNAMRVHKVGDAVDGVASAYRNK